MVRTPSTAAMARSTVPEQEAQVIPSTEKTATDIFYLEPVGGKWGVVWLNFV